MVIPSTELPDDLRNSTSVMTDISISEAGLLKLLKNLKPKKAAGPDKMKPVILQELRSELVRWPPCELNISCTSTTAESRVKIWYQ